jgi:hypothetical protein
MKKEKLKKGILFFIETTISAEVFSSVFLISEDIFSKSSFDKIL